MRGRSKMMCKITYWIISWYKNKPLNPIKLDKKGFSTETKRLSKLEQISLKQRAVPAPLQISHRVSQQDGENKRHVFRMKVALSPPLVELLTSGRADACGWWHRRRVHPWMRRTGSLFPHWGNRRMSRGTSLAKPSSEMPFLACELGEHGTWQMIRDQTKLARLPREEETGSEHLLLQKHCGQTCAPSSCHPPPVAVSLTTGN